eukprot:PhF_6_TR6913/c0_g1_i1/m.10065
MVNGFVVSLAIVLISLTPFVDAGVAGCNVNEANKVDCDQMKYLMGMIPSLVPFALGLLLLILFPFFICFRCICNCCGGRVQNSESWCCPLSSKYVANYSANHLRYFKMFVYGCTLITVIGTVLVCISNGGMVDGMVSMFDFSDILGKVDAEIDKLDTKLKRSDGTSISVVSLTDVRNTIKTVKSEVTNRKEEIQGTVKDIYSPVSSATLGVAIGASLMTIIGAALTFFNLRICVTYAVAAFIVIILPIDGLFFGVYKEFGAFINDFTQEVNAQKDGKPSIFGAAMSSCDPKSLQDLSKLFVDGERQAADSACQAVKSNCDELAADNTASNKKFSCSTSVQTELGQCTTVLSAQTAIGKVVAKDFTTQQVCKSGANKDCTIKQCADQCTDAPLQTSMKNVVQSLSDAASISDAYKTVIQPIITCNSFFTKFVTPYLLKVCDGFASANIISLGYIVCYIGLLLSLFNNIHGSKVNLPINLFGSSFQGSSKADDDIKVVEMKSMTVPMLPQPAQHSAAPPAGPSFNDI